MITMFSFQTDEIGAQPAGMLVESTGDNTASVEKSPYDPIEWKYNHPDGTPQRTDADWETNVANTKNKVLMAKQGRRRRDNQSICQPGQTAVRFCH